MSLPGERRPLRFLERISKLRRTEFVTRPSHLKLRAKVAKIQMRKIILNLQLSGESTENQLRATGNQSYFDKNEKSITKTHSSVSVVIVLPLRFIAQGSSEDSSPESLADPGKYSDDWRANGPPGGDVRSLVVDPSNPDRFYLGTLDGQIYTSADAGKTWQLLYNFNKPKLFVDHIIVDPRDSKTLYVAAHRHKEAGGFFKSTDGGRRWRESPELKNEALHSLIQADANPDVLIAGTFNGIFRSDNSGDSWTQLPTHKTPGLVHVESLAIDPRGHEHHLRRHLVLALQVH